MDNIHILQLGEEDWRGKYEMPKGIDFEYASVLKESPPKPYDLIFLDRTPTGEEIEALYQASKTYTIFVTEKVNAYGRMAWLYDSRKVQLLATDDIQRFLLEEVRYYFPKPYGEKFEPKNLAIAQEFSGSVKWNGSYSVVLKGEFGEEFRQIAYWRNNIPILQGQVIDLWLEYQKDSGVEISLTTTHFLVGSISEVVGEWEFSEEDLRRVVRIEGKRSQENIFVSLQARGSGELRIIALHDRYSRGRHGYFLPGGERYETSGREEIFCYFDPGDRKPPLNVYFSGYKTAQGFEGYHLMKSMGCPFLLLAEQRLEGGGCYVGSREYEMMFVDVIRKYMEELDFTSDQVILSGISMGSCGALYYGCDIRPHAMIVGKPVASLGNVAVNERLHRPGGFPSSLDVLFYQCGSLSADAVKTLNEKFWNKFDAVNWGGSKFIISYMIEDDYDGDAYDTLLSHLRSGGVEVYGKGIHGRHNDNTLAIVNWFSSQFKKILYEDFGRR